jgi:hypothetical protein
MSKMVRWALAFAAVTAIPGSAMAVVGDKPYDCFTVNGAQVVPSGRWRWTLDQLVFTDFDEACAFFVKWTIGGPDDPGGAAYTPMSSSNVYLEVTNTAGNEDCDENAYYPAPTFVQLSTGAYANMSKGFDKFRQKRSICSLLLGEDPASGDMNGLIRWHPAAMPYGFKAKVHY